MKPVPAPPASSAAAFAPIFAGLMVLWPIMSMLGAQGFTLLVSFAAIAALPYLRLPARFPVVGVLIALLVCWVSVTSAWSHAREGAMISGNLLEGTFALKISALRLVGTALAATAALMVALRVAPGRPVISAKLLIAVFAVNIALAFLYPVLLPVLLDLAYDDPIDALQQGMQNALRGANALTLILPIVAGLLWPGGVIARTGVVAGALALTGILAWLGTAAGVVAVMLAALAMLVVAILPRNGFRVLFALIAANVVCAPLLGQLASLFSAVGISPPTSFQARLWAWNLLSERIAERPFTGHGLETVSTWQETYADHPEWLAEIVSRGEAEFAWSVYAVVPGHPHNMALELWVETGLVGAVLAVAALLAIGWRLPRPDQMTQRLRLGLAGLIGASVSMFNFSYSAWNEAFWASLVLAAISLVIINRGLER